MTEQKVRQPNPIMIKTNGHKGYFYPSQFSLDDLKRLHEWLGRVIKWKEQP